MRFYDFMTAIWAVLWAFPTGVFVYLLAQPDETTARVTGAIAVVGMCLVVWFVRMARDPE